MSQLSGKSEIENVPGVLGEGVAKQAAGVVGISKGWTGVIGQSETASGVYGESQERFGVYGKSEKSIAVMAESTEGGAVAGISKKWVGVFGKSESPDGASGVRGEGLGNGVAGLGKTWHGVYGKSESSTGGAGVCGEHTTATGILGMSELGTAVYGTSKSGRGVWGDSETHEGVRGKSKSGRGVWASSEKGEGIRAETNAQTVAAVAAFNLNPNGKGAAVYAEKKGNKGHAGFFIGDVHITRNLTVDGDVILSNADCAEDFDVVDSELVEPGMVMVLGADGILQPCTSAYDKRVAGVISGAGAYKPGIILDKQPSVRNRQPIALLGKVYCKVDACFGAIAAGDLLTSSATPGHAMRTDDPFKAFGAIIGKALRPLAAGKGLIPILVTSQ